MVQSDQIHWHSWQPAGARDEDDYVRPCVCCTDRILRRPAALWSATTMPELFPGIRSLTVRRSVAMAVGGFEDSFQSLFDDQVFFTKLCAHSTVYVIEDYLALYRVHAESTMGRLRRSEYVAGGVWQRQTAAFYAWREKYLASLPNEGGVMEMIIAESRQQHATGLSRRVRLAAAAARRGIRDLLERVLPAQAYRMVLVRRRRLAARQTLVRYRRLCERMSQVADDSATGDRRRQTRDSMHVTAGNGR